MRNEKSNNRKNKKDETHEMVISQFDQAPLEVATSKTQSDSPQIEEAELETKEPELKTKEAELKTIFIKSVKHAGFWRCGKFWSHEGAYVVVVDDPSSISKQMNLIPITAYELNRLKAEPMLIVTHVKIGE